MALRKFKGAGLGGRGTDHLKAPDGKWQSLMALRKFGEAGLGGAGSLLAKTTVKKSPCPMALRKFKGQAWGVVEPTTRKRPTENCLMALRKFGEAGLGGSRSRPAKNTSQKKA